VVFSIIAAVGLVVLYVVHRVNKYALWGWMGFEMGSKNMSALLGERRTLVVQQLPLDIWLGKEGCPVGRWRLQGEFGLKR
jgi:hypothetical protein